MSQPIQVVVLGGAGAMGCITVKDLFETSDAHIVIADYNEAEAQRLAASYGSPRVEAAACDVKDAAATTRLLEGAFAVVNAVQYQHNLAVMRAALAAQCHYCDLGGLFHVTLEQLKLDAEFKAKNLLALVGVGAAPGTTNVLARAAADAMEEVHEIHIQLAGIDLNKSGHNIELAWSYSIQTILEEATRPAAVFTGGQMTFVEPMSGAKEVRFPDPVGLARPAYTIHSEVATLPNTYSPKGLQECTFAIAFEDHLDEKLRFLRHIGMNSLEPIPVGGQQVVPQDVLLAVLHRLPKATPEVLVTPNQIEILRAVVCGLQGGKAQQVVVDCVVRGMPDWGMGVDVDTGSPPSIVVQMLARGDITARGVVPPEVCVPVEAYFAELGKRRMTVHTQTSAWTARKR